MKDWLRRLFFNLAYLGHPRWDTGQAPPELLEFIQSHRPGRALDLGCGTGTNLVSLAEAGWQVVGVDFASLATRLARRRLQRHHTAARIITGDVVNLAAVSGPFDLILDIGCYHNLTLINRVAYRHNVERLLAPNGTWLLYFLKRRSPETGVGLTETDELAISERFQLTQRQDGTDGPSTSAWFWLKLPIIEEE